MFLFVNNVGKIKFPTGFEPMTSKTRIAALTNWAHLTLFPIVCYDMRLLVYLCDTLRQPLYTLVSRKLLPWSMMHGRCFIARGVLWACNMPLNYSDLRWKVTLLRKNLDSTNAIIILKNTTTLFSFLNTFQCFNCHHQPLWIYSKDLQNDRYI